MPIRSRKAVLRSLTFTAGTFAGTLILAACSEKSEVRVTSPILRSELAEQMGTPAAANLSASSARASITTASLDPSGPRVGVLAYCTDLTGSNGADNTASTLIADGRFSAVTVVDGDEALPSSQDLANNYDVVIAMTDNRCGIPIPQNVADAAADALTGFAESGGGVVLATFGFSDRASDGIGFGASIFGSGLSPLQPATPAGNASAGEIDVAAASTAVACQPLLDRVSAPVSSTYANHVSVSTGATLCASYTNERAFLAINSRGNIVGFNSLPASLTDNQQASYKQLVANAVYDVGPHTTETTREVQPGEAATITVKENGDPVAGIDIPADAFVNPDNSGGPTVNVTVSFRQVDANNNCHDYLISQIGRCLTITALDGSGNHAPLYKHVVVGVCMNVGTYEMFKFEEPTGRPVALRQVPADFLDCGDFQLGSAAPKNWLQGLAMGIEKGFGKLLTPANLYADHGGFGGDVLPDLSGLSIFTWAGAVSVSRATLAPNIGNSGKDLFSVAGTFGLEAKTFDPNAGEQGFNAARDAVTIGYGLTVQTIPAGSFKFSRPVGRWVYKSPMGMVTYMDIDASTGAFSVVGKANARFDSFDALNQVYRPFSIQIGHRARGAELYCGRYGSCHAEEPQS